MYLQCLQQTIQIPHNTEPCLHEVASGPGLRQTFPSAIHPTTLNTCRLWNQPCSLRFYLDDASILEILPLPFLPLQSLILQNSALVSCSPRRCIQLPWTVKASGEKHESSFSTVIHHLFPLASRQLLGARAPSGQELCSAALSPVPDVWTLPWPSTEPVSKWEHCVYRKGFELPLSSP